jgi:transposase-like protein
MAAAYSDELRAQVLSKLLEGQSVSSVARDFKIGKATVLGWRKDAGLNGHTPVGSEKRAELGELVLGYLRENLATLKVQAEILRDKAYLQKQPAESLAVLHGVMFDKAVRLLEALDLDSDQDEPAPPASEVPA